VSSRAFIVALVRAHRHSSHVAAFDVRSRARGNARRRRKSGTLSSRREVGDVVLAGTRVNAYDPPRVYDRPPISGGILLHPPSPFSFIVEPPFARPRRKKFSRPTFTPDYFWRLACACARARADLTPQPPPIHMLRSFCTRNVYNATPSRRRLSPSSFPPPLPFPLPSPRPSPCIRYGRAQHASTTRVNRERTRATREQLFDCVGVSAFGYSLVRRGSLRL
jgi:hypothetical protein